MAYRFVDRDMFMRFLGIGIGHCNQHSTDAELAVGRDPQTHMDDESDGDTEDTERETADDEDNDSDEGEGTDNDEFDGDSDGYDEL